MKGKLTLFIAVFLIAACFASAQDFYASGRASVDVCACSTAAGGFIVKNTGNTASTFKVQQSGDALKYSVSAPLSFMLMPGEEQVVAFVFSAPCGSSRVYQLNSVISNGISSKRLSQQFNAKLCTNASAAPAKKTPAGSVLASVWSTTSGRALILLPIMVIIIVLVVALAKRLADSIREKKAWEQPNKIVLKQPKHYFWEKMFPAEEEPVEITAPRRINWRLIITILAILLIIALLVWGTYYGVKSGLLTKQLAGNVTKDVTVAKNVTTPVNVTKNITKPVVVANATKPAMNFSKLAANVGSFANKVGSAVSRPVVKYSIIGVIAAALLIAAIILFRNFIHKHWKPLLFILLALAVIAGVWWYVYWNWAKVIGWLGNLRDFFVSYWLYIVSGLVVLGVIIAVILAVRSEENGGEQVVETQPVAAKPSRRKKSPKRKK
ncbi:MAG: hypothetical protein V1702_06300 [Candidatus Woesearchaeota archaeon]